MISSMTKFVIAVVLCWLVAGCADSKLDELSAWAAATTAPQAVKTDDVATARPSIVWQGDPFALDAALLSSPAMQQPEQSLLAQPASRLANTARATFAPTTAIQKLQWLGWLAVYSADTQRQEARGMLRLPDGQVIQVSLGALIGQETGVVTDIDETGLSIKKFDNNGSLIRSWRVGQ